MFTNRGPFSRWQGAGRSNCGSSCWNNWQTRTVSTSSRGRAIIGSSSCRTRTRWRAAGESARTNQRWTTRNYRADSGTITTRTLFIRRPGRDTCIGSCATCRVCWGTPPTSCSRRAEWRRSVTRTTSELHLAGDQPDGIKLMKIWRIVKFEFVTAVLMAGRVSASGLFSTTSGLAVRLRYWYW